MKSVGSEQFTNGYLAYSVVMLAILNALNYMDRTILGVLIEPLRAEFELSDTQIGLLTGIAYALFYAVAGVFIAAFSDRYSRRIVVSTSLVVFSAMTALSGAAQSFWHMLIARIGVGIGEASVIPCSFSLLADYFVPKRRAFAIGVFLAGGMVGVMAGSALGGWIADHYGWRWAFFAAALPGLPLALLLAWTLKDPQRGASDGMVLTEAVSRSMAFRMIFANGTLLLLILVISLVSFLVLGMLFWFPALIVRRYELTLSEVGAYFGLMVGFGSILGSLAGGWVANQLTKRDLQWMTRFPLILTVVLWPLYELVIFAPDYNMALTALFVTNVVGAAAMGPLHAALQTVMPANIRATGSAANGFAASLIGIGGAPLLIGALSDAFEAEMGRADGLQLAMGIAACAAVVAFVALIYAHRSFSRHERVQAANRAQVMVMEKAT